VLIATEVGSIPTGVVDNMLFDPVSAIDNEYPLALTTNSWLPFGVSAMANG